MNHLKHYAKLIRKAEQRGWTKKTAPCYVEEHHTFPKSLFGENKRVVCLTGKEHFVAHHLLYLAAVNRYGVTHYRTAKLGRAFWAMVRSTKNQTRDTTARQFEFARQVYSLSITGENHFLRNGFTETHKLNLSKAAKGKKKTLEHRKKIGEAHLGMKRTEEAKANMKLAATHKQKVKCPHCGRLLDQGNYNRWHGDNCKMKKD